MNNVPFLCTKLFEKRGHYSRGDIIQRGTLFKEIRYIAKKIIKETASSMIKAQNIYFCSVVTLWDNTRPLDMSEKLVILHRDVSLEGKKKSRQYRTNRLGSAHTFSSKWAHMSREQKNLLGCQRQHRQPFTKWPIFV